MTSATAFRISAAFGFLAVALGAFGAHGLKETLEHTGRSANWETAAAYHLIHAVVMLAIASREKLDAWAWRLFAAGVVIFSGSLYALAVSNVKVLGAITPIGGVFLLGGWLRLMARPR
ncbi:MAG: DUF423 domain-containing protein [Chthoniobacteraceae bacterium]